MAELKVLISRQDIAKRVSELGAQITKDFAGQSIIFVGVLKGAAIFLPIWHGKLNWIARSISSASPATATGPARPRNYRVDGTRPEK